MPGHDDSMWAMDMASRYFHQHPENDLQKFRHFIPTTIVKKFRPVREKNSNLFYGEPDAMMVYNTESGNFENKRVAEMFGKDDVYSAYIENFKRETFSREGFTKFDKLKRVDVDIQNGLKDPLKHIQQRHFEGSHNINLRREDVNTLRKYLYLTTSWAARERTSHLFAHNQFLETARLRRRKFVEHHGLDHVRDVWLHNTEQIISTPHAAVADNMAIFDLDRDDYQLNARERYIVFWEAPPGHEFLLTDSAFGGFEGGGIGDQTHSMVNMDLTEAGRHEYTRDHMWHQIYVLSPTLAVALCHPTLMDPNLIQRQRERWGLRKSLLEGLPHILPRMFYQDMTLDEMSFDKLDRNHPPGIQSLFGGPNHGGLDDEIAFPVQQLTPKQAALVNAVLLHNKENGPKIKNVCLRHAPSAQFVQKTLHEFFRTPWLKYAKVEQNDYSPLHMAATQITPPAMSPVLAPTMMPYPMMQGYNVPMVGHPIGAFEMEFAYTNGMYDGSQYLLAPHHHIPHNSAHSSLASLTPSSQSSYSFSSASSQASTSTTSTSLDTPRLDCVERHRQGHRKPRREEAPDLGRPRGESNAKLVRPPQPERNHRDAPQHVNIIIDQAPSVHSSPSGGVALHRGRNRDPRSDPPSKSSSKRSSPTNPPAELAHNPMPSEQRHGGPPMSRPDTIEERPVHLENSRPALTGRSRTEPHGQPVLQIAGGRPTRYHFPGGFDQHLEPQFGQRQRSPERPHIIEQPPRRLARSPERQPLQQQRPTVLRLSTAPQVLHYEEPHPGNAMRSPERLISLDARNGHYETTSQPISRQSSQSSHASRISKVSTLDLDNSNSESVVESQVNQIMHGNRPRLQIPNNQPHRVNRSPERKVDLPPVPNYTWEKPRESETMNGYYYEQEAPRQIEMLEYSLPPPPQRCQSKRGSANSSRNTSATSGHPMRLEQRPESIVEEPPKRVATKPPPPPVLVDQTPVAQEEVETPKAIEAPPQPEPPANPIIKQLRFETPPRKQLSHKLSDQSLAGSTVAHFGDSPYQMALVRTPGSDFGSDSETETGTESGDEASWEDEAAVVGPPVEKPKRVVRFADKLVMSPVRSNPAQLVKRVQHIESPNSRLGKSIPRPLSRGGQSRFERFESRKAKGTHPVFTRTRS
ncbi:hypothetical protein EX30DRAFT_395428 [Ascodesmis nigricans]|uniref:Uncharacterized protein n=1 Tax=Ascodesmis nigricans TaxID=341454 RepID=A0A4S2MY12_9PEZI|nr:hypothetical protein EX30DRAFT_395428 [Ascodesmis nigricans]